MWLLLSLLLIILLPLIIVVRIYNQLVTLKAQFENGFAQIEVQLRRRHDLIPNLVETVKGYLRHEQSTLTAVIEARNAASALLKSTKAHPADGVSMTMLGQAENRLGQALAGLNIQMEAYPELKANDNIQQLFEELTATENRVAFARQAFNDGVTEYNIYRKTFPAILIANHLGHTTDGALLIMDDPQLYHQTPQVTL